MSDKMKKTSWGEVADWYDDLIEYREDSYQKSVIAPNLLRLAEIKQDTKVIDIACGQGYFSRLMSDAGADVTGCDISVELIDKAKMHPAKNTMELFVSSADRLQGARDGYFDIATIILALQNIENLQGSIDEAFRVLKSGGKLIIVINHPAFRIPKKSSWQWVGSDSLQKEFRRIDAYMSDSKIEIDMDPGKNQKEKRFTVSFHRPLQSFFKALNKAGFAVTSLEEWISNKSSQPGPRSKEEDRMRKEIPMFLCLVAKKI
jgi:ubiquinone/menaquinone biosynthesis C-methylase UbiE